MFENESDIESRSSRTGAFLIRGIGTLFFYDDNSNVHAEKGKIVLGREAECRTVLAQVSANGTVFLMPIKSVLKIKWDKKYN